MNSPALDFSLVHYQPSGRAPVCGAGMRTLDRIESGEEKDKYALLRLHTTTDVRKVQCLMCRKWIRSVMASWVMDP